MSSVHATQRQREGKINGVRWARGLDTLAEENDSRPPKGPYAFQGIHEQWPFRAVVDVILNQEYSLCP